MTCSIDLNPGLNYLKEYLVYACVCVFISIQSMLYVECICKCDDCVFLFSSVVLTRQLSYTLTVLFSVSRDRAPQEIHQHASPLLPVTWDTHLSPAGFFPFHFFFSPVQPHPASSWIFWSCWETWAAAAKMKIVALHQTSQKTARTKSASGRNLILG